jgi:serine/threonine protein kinase
MGKVYRARDSRLGAVCVAIEISRKRFSGRFEREARAIAALNHPRICTLYDVGPNYLVLEPAEGETYAAFDADVPKPLSERAKVRFQFAIPPLAEARVSM